MRELLALDGSVAPPSARDLAAAFSLADEDEEAGAIDLFCFIKLFTLIVAGKAHGLGRKPSSSSSSSLLKAVLPQASQAEAKRYAQQRKAFKSALAGHGEALTIGDEVTWKSSDADIPRGTVGQVLFVHPSGKYPGPVGPDVEVLFSIAKKESGRSEPKSFTFAMSRLERVGGSREESLSENDEDEEEKEGNDDNASKNDDDEDEDVAKTLGVRRPSMRSSPLTLLSNSIGLTQPHLDAAKRGDLASFKATATAATINAKDLRGDAVLSCAAAKNHVEIVNACLALGAKVDTRGRDNWTALHRASKKGHAEVCYQLVKGGASVNLAGTYGFTALHLACLGNHNNVVLLLAETSGAKLNALNLYGNTPLHCAAERGFTDVCKLLVAKGASVEAKNAQGKTAANLARAKGFSVWKILRPAAARDRELWRSASSALFVGAQQDALVAAPEDEDEVERLASADSEEAPPPPPSRRHRQRPNRAARQATRSQGDATKSDQRSSRTFEVAPSACSLDGEAACAAADTWLFDAVPATAAMVRVAKMSSSSSTSTKLRKPSPPVPRGNRYEEVDRNDDCTSKEDDDNEDDDDEDEEGSEADDSESEEESDEESDVEEDESEEEGVSDDNDSDSDDDDTAQVSTSNSDSSFDEPEQL